MTLEGARRQMLRTGVAACGCRLRRAGFFGVLITPSRDEACARHLVDPRFLATLTGADCVGCGQEFPRAVGGVAVCRSCWRRLTPAERQGYELAPWSRPQARRACRATRRGEQ